VRRGLPGPVEAIIFDVDGVLTDSEALNFEALRRLLAGYGVRYTEGDNDAFIGVADREHLAALRAT
jgi:beta-phosphoglucomutase-like phosphatase (HAD superfamily)